MLVPPAPASNKTLTAMMLPCVTAIIKAVAPWCEYQFKERLACGCPNFLARGSLFSRAPMALLAEGPWPLVCWPLVREGSKPAKDMPGWWHTLASAAVLSAPQTTGQPAGWSWGVQL